MCIKVFSGDQSPIDYWNGLTSTQRKTVVAVGIVATFIIISLSLYFAAGNTTAPNHTPITPGGVPSLTQTATPASLTPTASAPTMQSTFHVNNLMGIDESKAAYKKLLDEAIKAGEELRKDIIEKGFCDMDQFNNYRSMVNQLNNINYTPPSYPWDIFWNNRFQAWGTFPNMHVDLGGFDHLLNLLKSISSGIV